MMKKLISYALTLSMLACMATTAFAVTDHVVGSYKGPDSPSASLDDGVYPFNKNDADTEYEVTIEVSAGHIQHRYAVDVTYEPVEMSITGGELTWDVNNLEYVSSDDIAGLGDMTENKITITNYSDLSVWVDPDIDDKDENDFISVTFNDGTEIDDNKTEIPKATTADGAQEKDIIYDIKVEEGHTWSEVAEYYAAQFNATGKNSATAATLTVKISAT